MGPDVPGAHARLASIEPSAQGALLLAPVLEALLLGAGAPAGALVDPSGKLKPAATGLSSSDPRLAGAVEGVGKGRGAASGVRPAVLGTLFAQLGAVEPRAVPLTAGDETLAFLFLPAAPVDPAGFASVTAHAASLLAWVRMAEKVREADFELKYRVWELESLYDVGLSIAGTLDLDSLAEDILLKSISLLNARAGTLVVRHDSEDGEFIVKSFGDPLVSSFSEAEIGGGVLVCNRPEERVGGLVSAPAEKLLAVPICSDGQPLGLLVVADKEVRGGRIEDFGAPDARILSLFGNQAAIALENARLHREAVEKEKMEREIQIAAAIQRTILPVSLPPVPGLAIAAANRPTRHVGGDFFDVHPLADGTVAFCVADVSGKGIPAALLVSTVHACIHLLVEAGVSDLPRMVGRINEHLTQFSATRKFVTLFLAVYDPGKRTLRYVNAGHNPGIWLSPGGVTLLPSGGLPIGMFPSARYAESEICIGPDDLVVLYSDGITEAVDGKDEEFGMERLEGLLLSSRAEEPGTIKDRIFEAVDVFTRGVAQYDDQTVLVARPA